MNHHGDDGPEVRAEGWTVKLEASVDRLGRIERLAFVGRSSSGSEYLHLTFPSSARGYRLCDLEDGARFFLLVLDGNVCEVLDPPIGL